MRHKTQLFNGAEDDHYHTRLQHTIEVEEIALSIAKRINEGHKAQLCSLDRISKISLLHDIGHTPFGHAGERALHEMVSGQGGKAFNLPSFMDMGIAIGFKHNLNSGLLYSESVNYKDIDFEVLDGIVKHSGLFYKKEDNLDYGFEYIFQGKSEYSDSNPLTIEGFIVKYADEIAQICSDYLDISQGAGIADSEVMKWDPYVRLNCDGSQKRVNARKAANYLIDLFVKCLKINKQGCEFSKSDFIDSISSFDITRSAFIKSNQKIKQYDEEKKKIIKKLFAEYYVKPEKMSPDFFDDFVYRAKRIKYTNGNFFHNNVEILKGNNPKNVINCVKRVENSLCTSDKFNKLSGNIKKSYRSFLKIYIRSIAVHISKMTDNYANHKYKELFDNDAAI